MSKVRQNGFDTISDLIDKNGPPVNSGLASMDAGANSFFEIGLPLNSNSTTSSTDDLLEAITIDNVDNTDNTGSTDTSAPNEPTKPKKTQTQKKSDNTNVEVEDDEEEDVEEVIDLKAVLGDNQDYDDYTDSALIALRQIKNGEWDLDEADIPKDLDSVTLMEMYDAQKKITVDKIKEDLYTQAGEYASYIKYLMDGGSPEVIQNSLELDKIILLDTIEEDNQKEILRAFFELKQMEDDVIEDTIEAIIDKGKGRTKAQEAIEQISKYKEQILELKNKELEDAKKAQEKAYQEHLDTFTSVVRKGKIGGVTVDKNKQDQIINAMFKRTELVEAVNPKTGQKEKTRVTKSSLLFKDVNSNPEKLAALTLWLLEGGDFEGIKEQAKVEKDDSLRELLKGRRTKTVINTNSGKKNSFDELAERANQAQMFAANFNR